MDQMIAAAPAMDGWHWILFGSSGLVVAGQREFQRISNYIYRILFILNWMHSVHGIVGRRIQVLINKKMQNVLFVEE